MRIRQIHLCAGIWEKLEMIHFCYKDTADHKSAVHSHSDVSVCVCTVLCCCTCSLHSQGPFPVCAVSGHSSAHCDDLWLWHWVKAVSHKVHKHTHAHTVCYLQAVCNGDVEVWKGSDTETCLLLRCSEETLGWFSPVTLTPAQLEGRKARRKSDIMKTTVAVNVILLLLLLTPAFCVVYVWACVQVNVYLHLAALL